MDVVWPGYFSHFVTHSQGCHGWHKLVKCRQEMGREIANQNKTSIMQPVSRDRPCHDPCVSAEPETVFYLQFMQAKFLKLQ